MAAWAIRMIEEIAMTVDGYAPKQTPRGPYKKR
jgi:hypothetical protein